MTGRGVILNLEALVAVLVFGVVINEVKTYTTQS